jgi:hypothetical protein
MKTTLASLALSGLMAASAFAGPVYSSKAVTPSQPIPPLGCECFAPGFALGIFGAGIIFEDDSDQDDSLGGGVLAEYFFTENIGVEGSYGIFATDSEHHEFDAALVVRFPITDICVAPYIMGGAGYTTNSDDPWNLFAGAGIDVRLPDMDCMAIFADGAYHWSEDDDNDFVIVRVGLKFPL